MSISSNRSILIKSFRELRKQGILAKSNFQCCQTCGCAMLSKIYEHSFVGKPNPKGYCFWHKQDEESLRKNGKVYLAFGVFDENEDSVEIGKKIVSIIKEHGLSCEWDESETTRILVNLI